MEAARHPPIDVRESAWQAAGSEIQWRRAPDARERWLPCLGARQTNRARATTHLLQTFRAMGSVPRAEVLVQLQKELHGEDFSEIFGGKAASVCASEDRASASTLDAPQKATVT